MEKAELYRVGDAIYRRNVPLSEVVYPGPKVTEPIDWSSEDEYYDDEDSCRLNPYSDETSHLGFNKIRQKRGETSNTSTNNITHNSNERTWSATVSLSKFVKNELVKNQSILKKMEASTFCTLEMSKNKTNNEILIKSKVGAKEVQTCLDQLDNFTVKQRNQARPTHFVSLALQSNELVKNYDTFCTRIKKLLALKDWEISKLSIVPTRLHLSLSMLVLFTDKEVEEIKQALEEVVETEVKQLLRNKPLTIHIKGLGYFGGKPSNARVLFAKVVGTSLMEVAKAIRGKMEATGLAKNENRDLTLHLTLFKSKKNTQKLFNLSQVLTDLSDFDFGTVEVSEVKICSMQGSTETNDYVTTHCTSLALSPV